MKSFLNNYLAFDIMEINLYRLIAWTVVFGIGAGLFLLSLKFVCEIF